MSHENTPAQDASSHRSVTRDSTPTSNAAMAVKVIEDIGFLRDRIERIKKLHTPNSTVLKTYEAMLASREAVLIWLQENGELPDDLPAPKAVGSAG
jgi:hypothetical protein